MFFSASSNSSWQEASCCRRKGRLLTWTFAREGCCAKRIDHYFNFLLESLIVPAISLWEFMLRGSPQGGCDCYAAGRVIQGHSPQGFFTMGCFTNSPVLVLHVSMPISCVKAIPLCCPMPLWSLLPEISWRSRYNDVTWPARGHLVAQGIQMRLIWESGRHGKTV